jgi:predicted O-methyltransferase YrrM
LSVQYDERLAYVAPFVPTPPRVLRELRRLARYLLRDADRQPILYDGGCGNGIVAAALAEEVEGYTICLELNRERAREARETARRRRLDHLVDVVVGDVLRFTMRRVSLAYTFLMPDPMDAVAEALPPGTVLVSLNFPTTRLLQVTSISVGLHTLFVYVKPGEGGAGKRPRTGAD